MKNQPINKQLVLSTIFCLLISCALAAAHIIGFFDLDSIFKSIQFWTFCACVLSSFYFGWRARSSTISENITAYFWRQSPIDCRLRAREAIHIAQAKENVETEKEKHLREEIDKQYEDVEKEIKERKGK